MHQVLTHEIMAQIKIRHRNHRRDPPPESYKFLKRLIDGHWVLLNGFINGFILQQLLGLHQITDFVEFGPIG